MDTRAGWLGCRLQPGNRWVRLPRVSLTIVGWAGCPVHPDKVSLVGSTPTPTTYGPVVELEDTLVLGTSAARRASSTLAGTT